MSREREEREKELALGPKVRVAKAVASATNRTAKFSGEARAYSTVTLYAKISGYLKDMRVDKGDRVKKGQVLATIESPETEQAYIAAQSEAKNKRLIAERIKSLLDRQLVSQQEADQAFADSEVSAARLSAQEAQRQYQTIRAPFDGTITSRFADPGALVQNATNAQTGALPLLSISQLDQLRIYVYLDQREASYAKVGTTVEVSVTEHPDAIYSGKIARISGQLDERTRMLLTEIDLDNGKSQIVAGSLVNVSMQLSSSPGIEIPSDALVLRGTQTFAAVLNDQDQLDFKEVRVSENSGEKAKISSGIEEGQRVVMGVGNSIAALTKVRPIEDAKPAAAAVPAAGSATPASPAQPAAAGNEVRK
ncbi:MAG: efflux RND transporter periplasmic adaptor subunit [Proteobacteria bacterium]|nr:MAG: efflux RND transporter periplasmic adaptor subunit [Pseudomonadota bacterium]